MTGTLRSLALLASLTASSAHALINPSFTPVELVADASAIAVCRIHPGTNGDLRIETSEFLKGTHDAPASVRPARAVRHMLVSAAVKPVEALAFWRPRDASTNAVHAGSMLTSAGWTSVVLNPDGSAVLAEDGTDKKAVWNGSPVMLASAVRDILAHGASARVPAVAGTSWGSCARTARVQGRISACAPVRFRGHNTLFVSTDRNDRLFAPDGRGGLSDITADAGLSTASERAAWGDMDGDRLPDLLSVLGKTVSVHRGGTNVLAPTPLRHELPDAVLDVSFLGNADSPTGRAIVLTRAGLTALSLRAGAIVAAQVPSSSHAVGEARGGRCVCADLDGDGLGDIACAGDGLLSLWRGTPAGNLAPVAPVVLDCGQALCALTGDYDNDGRLDLLIGGDAGIGMLRNAGGMRFEPFLEFSGELAYAGKPGATTVSSCDVNNDGKEEFLLFYPDQGPLPFFARGYFSFGFAKPLDFGNRQIPDLQQALHGQQAAALADFDDDGAQEAVFVTPEGDLFLASQQPRVPGPLSLTVIPGAKAGAAVNVEARVGKLSLGVRPCSHASPAFFGIPQKGPVTVSWRGLDGAVAERRILIVKPATVTLD